MSSNISIIGLDTHKNSIDIVTAETFGNREVRHYGKKAAIWHHWTERSESSEAKMQNCALVSGC